ncbi:NAD(P)-binding domain-containing protein [Variovorax sp. GT1P44]|uniref:NAD(P)-binding domain-containing protein n=1 Tax=Variovorax sp. GT1P44 TaxID=3443742 RepID=UPI003F4532DF
MTYAIIGTGDVAASLARRFARIGIAACIANTPGPESVAESHPVRTSRRCDADVHLDFVSTSRRTSTKARRPAGTCRWPG